MPLALVDAAGFRRATLYVVAFGNVTFEEVRTFQTALLADARLCCGVQMFCDARTVTGAPSAGELRIIAAETAPLIDAGLGPIAILCASPFTYGVARMFAVLAEAVHANVGAFRDFVEAQDWLDRQAAAA